MENKPLLTIENLHTTIKEYFEPFGYKIDFHIEKEYLSIRVWDKENYVDQLFDIYELNEVMYDKVYHVLENIRGLLMMAEVPTVILQNQK